MSESLVHDITEAVTWMLPERFKAKPAPAKPQAPSYRFLKSQAEDQIQFRRVADWLERSEKHHGPAGSADALTAIRLVQKLSFTDPKTAVALLDQAQYSKNAILKKEAIVLHAHLVAEVTSPAAKITRSTAAQPALQTLSR